MDLCVAHRIAQLLASFLFVFFCLVDRTWRAALIACATVGKMAQFLKSVNFRLRRRFFGDRHTRCGQLWCKIIFLYLTVELKIAFDG